MRVNAMPTTNAVKMMASMSLSAKLLRGLAGTTLVSVATPNAAAWVLALASVP